MSGAGSFVYFLRPVGQDGPVKIGCSQLPEARLSAYLPWSPMKLEIAATIRGNQTVEARFHHRFRSSWMHGEWFEASGDLTATIAEVAAGTFDIDTLPEPKRLPAKRPPMTPRRRLRLSYGRRLSVALRGFYSSRALEALCREIEVGPESAVPAICATLDQAIENPADYAQPIMVPWAIELRAQRGLPTHPQREAA